MADVVVVGGGIVGLATAARLAGAGRDVTVLEKEPVLAAHQTGRNSGVIHSGLYYAPGSLKAGMAAAGSRSMLAFAAAHGIAARVTGKLVVATRRDEVEPLHALAERAAANDVPARLVTREEALGYEPDVVCLEALRVESTGIIDYAAVCRALAEEVRAAGGRVLTGTRLLAAREEADHVRVRATTDRAGSLLDLRAESLVVCGGLQADRLARACGLEPDVRIVPFRGEYFTLADRAAARVRGLVYPVPDPRFPFLGVHLTRGVHDDVHVGPNAVLALAREGYTWHDVSPADVVDEMTWPGLWSLAARNLVPGVKEIVRSLSRPAFAASVARILPGVTADDLIPAPAGVRAQALRRDGTLVDDFLVATTQRQVHVLNAPSPAATASLEIARHVVDLLPR